MGFVLPDKVIHSAEDLVLTLQNNLGIAFGAAAITLNRCREEVGVPLENPIQSEVGQF